MIERQATTVARDLTWNLEMLYPVGKARDASLYADERSDRNKVLQNLKALSTNELWQACKQRYPNPQTGQRLLPYLIVNEFDEGATYVLEQIASRAEQHSSSENNPLRQIMNAPEINTDHIHRGLSPLELALKIATRDPTANIFTNFLTRFQKLAPKNYQAITSQKKLQNTKLTQAQAPEQRSKALTSLAQPAWSRTLTQVQHPEHQNLALALESRQNFGASQGSCLATIQAIAADQRNIFTLNFPDQQKGIPLLPLLLLLDDKQAALALLDIFAQQGHSHLSKNDSPNPLLQTINNSTYTEVPKTNILHIAIAQRNLEFIQALAKKASRVFAELMLTPDKRGHLPLSDISQSTQSDFCDMLDALTKHHAPADLDYTKLFGSTDGQSNNLLHQLIKNGNTFTEESLDLLLDCEPDAFAQALHQPNKKGDTPVHLMLHQNGHPGSSTDQKDSLRALATLAPEALAQALSNSNKKNRTPLEQIPGDGRKSSLKHDYIQACCDIESPASKLKMISTLLKLKDDGLLSMTNAVAHNLAIAAKDAWLRLPLVLTSRPERTKLHPSIQAKITAA